MEQKQSLIIPRLNHAYYIDPRRLPPQTIISNNGLSRHGK